MEGLGMSAKPLAIVVDDDIDVRAALRAFLAEEDVEAAEAEDGIAGLDLVKRATADLAFVDLQLPRLDGLSLLKAAKAIRPVLPVVMMSGLASTEDIIAALENGAYTFITKPCDFVQLAKIVEEILMKNLPAGSRRVRVTGCIIGKNGGGATPEPGGEKGGRKNMALMRWSPFRDLITVQQELNRLFDDLMSRRFEGTAEGTMWLPAVDISETPDAVRVQLEIPGVKKEDVKVTVTNNVLTVRGEKKMEKEVKEENYHRIERAYGSFVRSLELPTAVAADKVKATYENGVLTVVLPKSDEVKPKEIPIES